MYIKYAKMALKTLKRYDKSTRTRIRDGLTKTPPEGDIKLLRGSEKEFRLKVGKYRIIYEYLIENDSKCLIINKIDTRGDIYK